MIQEQLNPCNVLIGLSLYLTIALFVWQDVVLAQILCRPVPAPVLMGTVVNYTPEKHGTVPSVYIKCLQDRALLPAAQDYIIEETPQEEVIEMDTDHTPMLSAPKELHQILMQLAKKYAHGGV